MKLMKKLRLFAFLALSACASWAASGSEESIDKEAKKAISQQGERQSQESTQFIVKDSQKQVFALVSYLLENHNFRSKIFQNPTRPALMAYINTLDSLHIYFLQSDIDEFLAKKEDLYTLSRNGDLTQAIDIYKVFSKRYLAMNEWAQNRLDKPFDFNSKEVIENDDDEQDDKEKKTWFKTEAQAQDYVEKYLLNELIQEIIGGKSEEEAVKTLKKRYQNARKQAGQITMDDIFSLYINSIAGVYDPHTNYFAPVDKENFDIGMRLSLDGIGATLTQEDGKIAIYELVVGGPAQKSGKLKVKDKIIAVGQGKDGELQDITGMRLDKAIRLIRGKKGTTVRLLIEPNDSAQAPFELLLKRDTINLDSQAAQSYIETVEQNGVKKKLGVIHLPSFYADFEAASKGKKDFRSTSADVAKELEKLKKAQVEGILLDLRGNGGGALTEAIQTVGLFIDKGPVVMTSDMRNKIVINEDEHKGVVYSGPLAVMVDQASASASEIVAGAIQDYQRGIIIGNTTFGKGTVQSMFDLDNFVNEAASPLGELKLTIAMYYRINGESTQLRGVEPDVSLPTSAISDKGGERAQKYALPWRKIGSATYTPYDDYDKDMQQVLLEKHQARMENTPAMKAYAAYIERLKEEKARKTVSLNLEERKAKRKEWKAYLEQYKTKLADMVPALNADAKRKKQIEERNKTLDEKEEKQIFVPDIGLYEGLEILFDYVEVLQEQKVSQPKAA